MIGATYLKNMFRCTKLIFTLSVVIYYYQPVAAYGNSKLLFVQILFRHGDRSPEDPYPTDPNPESFWPEGYGQLKNQVGKTMSLTINDLCVQSKSNLKTNLGRKQHHALGKYFRYRYRRFITSSPLEVNASSSDVDRCVKSALCNLAAFYAPDPAWKYEDDLPWQPIRVHYIPKMQDKYLEVNSDCPRADKEEERIENSPAGQAFINEHKVMFESLSNYSGSEINNWKTAAHLFKVLYIERKYNLITPTWALPWWDELKYVADMNFYWSFSTPLIQRLRAGPLLELITQKMNSKISGDLPHQLVQIYSTHETNVAVVLNALNLFNMKIPPFCASVIFELHEIMGRHMVRLLFMNSTEPALRIEPPHVLVLDGCQEFCPLNYFIEFIKHIIPKNWKKECK